MMKSTRLLILLFTLFSLFLWGDETGTLIVTYNTGKEGERLDRVRFWVRNEHQEQQMYPKGAAYVDHPEAMTRMVVIDNLLPGNYSIEFLVPNVDDFFDFVPIRKFTIASKNVVKIEQSIKPRESFENSVAGIPDVRDSDEIAQRTVIINNPYFYPYGFEPYGYVTVNSNFPDARWTLYSGSTPVGSGSGFSSYIRVKPGSTFQLKADKIPGYDAEITPSGYFTVLSSGEILVSVNYVPLTGNIEIRAELSQGTKISGKVVSDDRPDIEIPFHIVSEGGLMRWRTPDLPTGKYTIYYDSQGSDVSAEPQKVQVVGKRTLFLAPQFAPMGSIQVVSNIPAALYRLSLAGEEEQQGDGNNFTFRGLQGGNYEIEFTSEDPNHYVAPPAKKIFLRTGQKSLVTVHYDILGELHVVGDVDRFEVKIQEINGKQETKTELISNGSGTFYLGEGSYRLTFNPSVSGVDQPKFVEVKILPKDKKEIKVHFPKTLPHHTQNNKNSNG